MRTGELLKMARQAKGWAQLELALSLDVSQRHVSFVESGRTRPSKELIVGWMLAVDAHPDLLRAALLHAGFAAEDECSATTACHRSPLPDSIRLLLEASNPMPLIVFNGSWIMSGMNAAGEWLAAEVMTVYWRKLDGVAAGMNMLDAVIDPEGLLSTMLNAKEAALALALQAQRESWANDAILPVVDTIWSSLSRRYGIAASHRFGSMGSIGGVGDIGEPPRRFHFRSRFGDLSFQTVQSVLQHDVNNPLRGMRLEQWIPLDRQTQAVMSRQSFAGYEAGRHGMQAMS